VFFESKKPLVLRTAKPSDRTLFMKKMMALVLGVSLAFTATAQAKGLLSGWFSGRKSNQAPPQTSNQKSDLPTDICNSQADIQSMSYMGNEEFKAFQKNDQKIDQILVSKKFRRIYLLKGQKLVRSYPVAFGNPNGPKRIQGDNKTPEGTYFISRKNPYSNYYMALEISWPNKQDIENARRLGKSPGGDVMVHGLPRNPFLHKKFAYQHPIDWTRGCVAVNDTQIREIYSVTEVKTPITICPLK
jgi:murein L,D-transpeptidase YafK